MAKDTFPANWDWNLIGAGVSTENTPKVEKKVNEIFGNTTETEQSKQEVEELENQQTEKENHIEGKEDNKEVANEPIEEENKEEVVQNDLTSNDSGIDKESEENENDTHVDDNVEETNEENCVENPNAPEENHKNTHELLEPDATEEEHVKSEDIAEHDDDGENQGNTVDNQSQIEDSKEDDNETTHQEDENNIGEDEDNKSPISSPKINSPARTISINNSPINSKPNSPAKAKNIDEVENDIEVVDGEGVIEGVVNGENEVESVNEEGTSATDIKSIDPEIAALIESGNMEQLAALVLNGQGEKLVGQKSDNAELQAFLDNVPIYMVSAIKIVILLTERWPTSDKNQPNPYRC